MKQSFVIVILLLFVGCAAGPPRYKKGGQERPGDISNTIDQRLTTNDNIKLGQILQTYLGRPYKGRSKYDPGLDCSHFTQSVFKQFNGLRLPRTAAEQYQTGDQVHLRHLKYGDLVFFNTVGRDISHVGIYVGHRRFIHASTSRGVIISEMKEKYWADRYVGARRIIE